MGGHGIFKGSWRSASRKRVCGRRLTKFMVNDDDECFAILYSLQHVVGIRVRVRVGVGAGLGLGFEDFFPDLENDFFEGRALRNRGTMSGSSIQEDTKATLRQSLRESAHESK